MVYRDDPDLEFFRCCSSTDLHPLVNYLTKDKDGNLRLTETLTKSDKYRACAPSHSIYWDLVAAELQTFGANSIASLFRGGQGVLYREILTDVCDNMKVNYSTKAPTEIIESNLLMKVLTDSLGRMDDNAKQELVDGLGIKTVDLTGPAIVAALQAGVQAGGFAAYKLAVIVANAVANAVLGHGLAFATNAALTRAIGIATGPVGWAITGLWTIGSLAGPAYRVTVPSTIHVAFLRIKQNTNPQDLF